MNLEKALAGNRLVLLDESALIGMRLIGGEETTGFVSDMIDVFLTDALVCMQDMTCGHEAGDLRRIQGAAHTLQLSAAHMGAVTLAHVCEAIEEASRAGARGLCGEMLEACQEAYNRTKEALLDWS